MPVMSIYLPGSPDLYLGDTQLLESKIESFVLATPTDNLLDLFYPIELRALGLLN